MNNNVEKKESIIEKRKKEIISAAMVIFAKNGFRRTKIDDIANYLDVGKGTLYRYFKSKKELFITVFKNGVNELIEEMGRKVNIIEDPVKKQRKAVETYFKFFDSKPELIEIMMQVRSEFKDEYRQHFLDCYKDYILKIQNNLKKGIQRGQFRELDIEKTADAVSASMFGVLISFYVRKYGREDLKLTEMAEPLSDMILKGLEKKKQ